MENSVPMLTEDGVTVESGGTSHGGEAAAGPIAKGAHIFGPKRFHLTSDIEKGEKGAAGPGLGWSVRITNNRLDPVVLARAMLGSEQGIRAPSARFEIRDAKGQAVLSAVG